MSKKKVDPKKSDAEQQESSLKRWLKERRITEKKTRAVIKRGRSSRVDHDG